MCFDARPFDCVISSPMHGKISDSGMHERISWKSTDTGASRRTSYALAEVQHLSGHVYILPHAKQGQRVQQLLHCADRALDIASGDADDDQVYDPKDALRG